MKKISLLLFVFISTMVCSSCNLLQPTTSQKDSDASSLDESFTSSVDPESSSIEESFSVEESSSIEESSSAEENSSIKESSSVDESSSIEESSSVEEASSSQETVNHLYYAFTPAEKTLFRDYIGADIPFIEGTLIIH